MRVHLPEARQRVLQNFHVESAHPHNLIVSQGPANGSFVLDFDCLTLLSVYLESGIHRKICRTCNGLYSVYMPKVF